MLMFNALIKAKVVLFAAFAALAAPPSVEVSGELTDEAADVEANQSVDPSFPIEDEADPSLAARCYDDDDWKKRGYCLAKCDDDWRYRAVSDEMRIRGNNDWCKKRARKHCKHRGEHLDDWCWGRRSGHGGWDDDDDDDWDDDDDDHDDWDDDDHDGHGHGGGGGGW